MIEIIIGTFVSLVLIGLLFAIGFFGARFVSEKRETMKLIRRWLKKVLED